MRRYVTQQAKALDTWERLHGFTRCSSCVLMEEPRAECPFCAALLPEADAEAESEAEAAAEQMDVNDEE